MAKKRRKSNFSATGYNSMVKRLVKLKRQGKYKQWRTALKRASAYRKRMIAANRSSHPAPPKGKSPACAMMSPESKRIYLQQIRTKYGKRVANRFKEFWKIPCPPSIKLLPGGPKGRTIPLVGMGYTLVVHLADKDKGGRGGKKKVLKGRWNVATEQSGRHVLLLCDRPIKGKFMPVGFAPETHYIPPPDVEKAGTHKAGLEWRHRHGVDDEHKNIPPGKLHWPRVYADRGGKVDAKSNFAYDKTATSKITDWMYG